MGSDNEDDIRCDLELDYVVKFLSYTCVENACNFFRWRNREDVDIRSKFVILRLANRIKELEIDDESHIKRSNKWVMKGKKKAKCCNNWKLIFVLFVVAYVVTNDPYVTTFEAYVATDETYVATDDPYIATYETYVATDDPYVATYGTYVTTFDQVLALNITSHTMYLLSI
ncbi:hypothetical protein H5410_061538 [Solanum commersonii]|uniref:Uncharacterized protein n=1 Tax=Solanum commersonii TaxID=4109 RepID=A0A9J5W958_SOLCO|nr:hypothetical protein H5410_061538 [Solanum commersonii]